jgi:hypothetical protein
MHAINDRTYRTYTTGVTRTSTNTTSQQCRSVSGQREVVSIAVDHFTGSSIFTANNKEWKAREPARNDHELSTTSSASGTSTSMHSRQRVR